MLGPDSVSLKKIRKQLLKENFICDLSSVFWLDFNGPDAETFLNAQLTNDLRQLTPAATQLQAYCSPKGRVRTLMRVHREGDGLRAQLPAELADAIATLLRKFVLRASVTIDAAPCASFGVVGDQAADRLRERCHDLPAHVGDLTRHDGFCVIRLPCTAGARFQVAGDFQALRSLWPGLRVQIDEVSERCWWREDIAAGQPRVLTATSEMFVPQMLNLDLVGGVSFHKGCYPGQEIVARMRYLGTLKKRMIRAGVDDLDTLPNPGDPVYVSGDAATTAGTVVDAQPGLASNVELLAVVQLENLKERRLCLTAPDGPALRQLALPYELSVPEQAQGS